MSIEFGMLITQARFRHGESMMLQSRFEKYFEAKRLSEYARVTDMKFVSGVIGMVRRLEFRAKSMAEDLAYAEMENFILLNSPAVRQRQDVHVLPQAGTPFAARQ